LGRVKKWPFAATFGRMSRKALYVVIVFAFLSLAGVVMTQIYWVRQAYSIQEKEFNDRVIIAMSSVVDRIQAMNHDSALVEPVKQVSANFFVANINDTLHPYLLESLLREEFLNSNLTADFEYGIYDCFTDSIVFGSKLRFEHAGGNPVREEVSIQKKFERDGHYFGIYYPSKHSLMLANMQFWIYSSFLILLVVVFFSYTIMVILRQRRLSEVKTDFINNMTHELKTPISTIMLSTDMLLKNADKPESHKIRQYAEIIKSENQRLRSQVEKVLQIATLSPEKMNLKKKALDVHLMLEEVVASAGIRVAEKEGAIHLNKEAMESVVEADSVHLANVLHNLMDNAIKYCEGTPNIYVVTRNEGGHLLIAVKDNGIGIAPEQLNKIFDKFYRVPTGDVHNVKGFGLGLFYVKTIMNAHGGKVWATGNPGVGSEFTLQLPLKK
jgi:two-component system, OmpR family, phosphate regulon sensor histidine kinase PhoR